MVADMQRLESAARLAMGTVEEPGSVPHSMPTPHRILIRAAILVAVLAAAGLLAATV